MLIHPPRITTEPAWGFVYYMLLSMGILLNGNTKVPTLNFIYKHSSREQS